MTKVFSNLRRQLLRRLLPAVVVCAACFPVFASQAPLPEGVTVGQLQVLEDPAGQADLDSILAQRDRFRDVYVQTPNYDFSRSAYWFRMPIRNERAQSTALFLDILNPLLDHVTLYVVGPNGVRTRVENGDRIPANERSYPATSLVLPFRLEAREAAELWLRVQSDAGGMLVPYAVFDEPGIREFQLTARALYGVLTGVFLALFCYNLLLYLQLRERTYLYYVAYLTFSFLSVTAFDGFGPAVLYPTSVWPGNEGLTVFSGVAYLCILAFTRAFLATPEHPRLDLAVKLLMVASLALTFAPLLVPMNVSYQILTLTLFVFPLASGGIGFISWRRGRREARFFVLGQAASWIGLLAVGLMLQGVVPFNIIVGEGVSIGIAADALLLAFALADRIRLLQNGKLAAENSARKNLELRREELERVVSERTSELEIARKRAETLATIDPLTSILNRRGLLQPAEREVKIARRGARPLAVVMFDLDHFKRVNDRYGHAEGDRVLRDVAAEAKACVRQTDLFGRIGGEEFLIVLPEAEKDIARQTAERIRRRIEANVAVGEPREPITASFGVTWLSDEVASIDALESSADAALYRAKSGGRNRVELADVVKVNQ